MKNYNLSMLLFVVFAFAKAYTLQAQNDFKAKATYVALTKINIPEDSTNNKKAESNPMIKQLMEQLKKGSTQEYILEFTRTESSYDKVKELKKPGGPSGMSISFSATGGVGSTVYKNLLEKTYIKQGNIMGKDFVIKDVLPSYEWQLLSESKMIGKYNCFKAIYLPIKKEQEIDEEEELEDGEEEESGTSLLSMVKESDRTITAWYTPDIPVSNGPGEFHGLPGLIVEIQINETTILLKGIEINPKEGLELKKPKAGKKINQKDFDALQKKKMEERMENRGNGKGVYIETIGF
ncbi:GLPGLI family protein [Nonlabens sp.]|uniref:GLPGLI family protein n=1 Tax=Nonlabens sp. TaxID=1888209 RepID=UPI001BCFC4E3|nr:GLPGLI family protein [Nonlabens sp.]